MDELYKNSAQAQAINQMYDAQKQQQLGQLESAYNQQRSNYEAAAAKIPQQYQTQANDLAAQYERQRRNFNQQAAASGLNTGAASQAQLGQNSAYQRAYAGLRTAQADAQTEADRQMLMLEDNYKQQVAAAVGNNDYERARALLNEYNNYYNRQMQQAQTLASYGDFSGYANLYGQDAAGKMAATWNASNPNVAYGTGAISAQQYYNLTGKWPAGYEAQGGNRRSGYTPTPKDPPAEPKLTPYEMGLEIGRKYGADAAKEFAASDKSELSDLERMQIFQGISDQIGLRRDL